MLDELSSHSPCVDSSHHISISYYFLLNEILNTFIQYKLKVAQFIEFISNFVNFYIKLIIISTNFPYSM